MFYYLNGKLAYKDLSCCVIDCGGVGYKLTISQITSDSLTSKLDKEVRLFTHLAVREDGIELFGFESNEERECFNKLISVSGVGPKAAMSILSIMTPDNFAIAVCTEDAKAISKASGIGGKTAARIILELKDKLSADLGGTSTKTSVKTISPIPRGRNLSEAAEALMVLGYDKTTVTTALSGLDPSMETSLLIRSALKRLAK